MKYLSLDFIFVNKCLGGSDGDHTYDTILEFNKETGEWSQLDRMIVARRGHAVSVIPIFESMQYCY